MTTQTTTARDAYTRVAQSAEAIRNDEQATIPLMDAADCLRQGDIYVIRLGDTLPARADDWTGRQVAEGTTQGSRHTVEGPAVELYRPESASAQAVLAQLVPATAGVQQFFGPVIRASATWTLAHPEHGDRVLPAGDYLVTQQRAYAEELRRAQD